MNKKKFLQLKLNFDKSYYELEQYSPTANLLDYLRFLLTSDIGYLNSNITSWKKKIENLKEDKTIGGNIIYFRKYDEIIIIYNELVDEKYFLKISQQNFLEVLDQWEQLCKEKPKEIWIFEENGKVWLEGKN